MIILVTEWTVKINFGCGLSFRYEAMLGKVLFLNKIRLN